MNYRDITEGLVALIKQAPSPKEAEWIFQDKVTELLRKGISKSDFSGFLNQLSEDLHRCKEDCGLHEMTSLLAIINIVSDYKTLL